MRFLHKSSFVFLALIFLFALIIRFLYFPNNIYFGFDQARDAFAVKEILTGHIKLIGPPTTFEGLNHGSLYYYLYAPFYWISSGDPAVVAAFLRVVNAFGVVLIFLIARILFNKYVAFISAWLFAISFEQTQFALYFNHPSFALISILFMFFGLSLLIFRKNHFGLIIAFAGLGLSIQFEFLLTYLIITFITIYLLFKKSMPPIPKRTILLGSLVFIFTISTFIIAEIKFSFRSSSSLYQLLFDNSQKSLYKIISTYLFEMGQVIKFNLTGMTQTGLVAGLVILTSYLWMLFSSIKKQIVFLGIWFFSGIIIYFVGGGEDLSVDIIQYHPNVGISISLLIFTSYLLYILGKRSSFYITLLILIVISAANFSLIQKVNPNGSMPEINAQSFMLLSDEKKILDYIYHESRGKEFAVKAITLPFYINTTWSYLFEWYGKQKYGYLPVWNGKNALGFAGNLKVEEAQDKAPFKRYLIIEPIRGIPQHLIDDYLKEEEYFSDISKEVEIGKFKLQLRHKKQ